MPINSGKRWSPSDEQKLKQLANQSATTEAIAKTLGRSEGAIRGKSSDLNITLKPDDRKKR